MYARHGFVACAGNDINTFLVCFRCIPANLNYKVDQSGCPGIDRCVSDSMLESTYYGEPLASLRTEL